jgi:hypothetical protein
MIGTAIGAMNWWRRLPSLPHRGFPNRVAFDEEARPALVHFADWEIGDTAGLETCATSQERPQYNRIAQGLPLCPSCPLYGKQSQTISVSFDRAQVAADVGDAGGVPRV